MSKLGVRLRELRTGAGYTQKSIAEMIGVAQSTYTMYETGNREPGLEMVCKLADFFKTTTDFLLGMSDFKNADEKKTTEQQILNFINHLMSINEKHRSKIIDCMTHIVEGYAANSDDTDFIEFYIQNIDTYGDFIHFAAFFNALLYMLVNGDIEENEIANPNFVISSFTDILEIMADSNKLLKMCLDARYKLLVDDYGNPRDKAFAILNMFQQEMALQETTRHEGEAETNADT